MSSIGTPTLEQIVSSSLRKWLEDPSKYAESSAQTLNELLNRRMDMDKSIQQSIFTELNMVLFRRCIECEWTRIGDTPPRKVENPLFLIARRWFVACPDLQTKTKATGSLRKMVLDALDEVRSDLNHEPQVVQCLELLEMLMDVPDLPEFSLSFLKLQRFTLDAVGRHIRFNPENIEISARSAFTALRILFRHSTRVLFDAAPALVGFFDMYPRWPDVELLRSTVVAFLNDQSLAIAKRTLVFVKFRGDILRAYPKCNNNEEKIMIENLVELWAQESVAPSNLLMLETLSEDPVRGRLSLAVLKGCAKSKMPAQCIVEALNQALRAEIDGAVPSLPHPVLNYFQEIINNQEVLKWLEANEIPSEWTAGLLSLSPPSVGSLCWFLGEAGSRRDWSQVFDGIRTVLAVVNLSPYERRAAAMSLVKFALRATKSKRDYRMLTLDALEGMPCQGDMDEGIRRRCIQLIHAPLGLGALIVDE